MAKPTDKPATSQKNFKDPQEFDIKVEKIYSDFIQAIDKVRSYNNCSKIAHIEDVKAIEDSETIRDVRLELNKLCSLDKVNPQESRCHAFFRIIGFPVCDASYKIYSPGHDIIFDADRKVTDLNKIAIINNEIFGFRSLSLARENTVNNFASIFSNPTTIDAGTLALSSVNLRNFIDPIQNLDPFDTIIKIQKYDINLNGSVGGVDKSLTEFIDLSGNKPTKLATSPNISKRIHVIKPFLVDPVIDLTVNDSAKLIAIPFVLNKNNLKVRESEYVSRPIIEKIIRDKFSVLTVPAETPSDEKGGSGTSTSKILDYISTIPDIRDDDLLKKITDTYSLSDQFQFAKYLNIIKSMMKKLILAKRAIEETQSKYYWLPIPAKNGPEGGCTSNEVFLFTDSILAPPEFTTIRDFDIIEAYIKKEISVLSVDSAKDTTTDVGGYAISNDDPLTSTMTGKSTALGDNLGKNLDSLLKIRTDSIKKANDALKTIEVIMGEFSGLGLCDIIAIIGSLYLLKLEDLVAFIDADARTRMIKALKMKDSLTVSSFEDASTKLVQFVNDFYNIMDKIYQDQAVNNG